MPDSLWIRESQTGVPVLHSQSHSLFHFVHTAIVIPYVVGCFSTRLLHRSNTPYDTSLAHIVMPLKVDNI